MVLDKDSLIDPLVYVVAGDKKQALQLMRVNELNVNLLYYIDSVECLHGIEGKGKTLYCYGNYFKRPASFNITELAKHRGWEVKEVD